MPACRVARAPDGRGGVSGGESGADESLKGVFVAGAQGVVPVGNGSGLLAVAFNGLQSRSDQAIARGDGLGGGVIDQFEQDGDAVGAVLKLGRDHGQIKARVDKGIEGLSVHRGQVIGRLVGIGIEREVGVRLSHHSNEPLERVCHFLAKAATAEWSRDLTVPRGIWSESAIWL